MTRRQVKWIDFSYLMLACITGNAVVWKAYPTSLLWRLIIIQILIGSVSVVSYITGMTVADKIAKGKP